MNPSIDYYKILGISPTATTQEIKKAFRKLALLYHPDRNPGRQVQLSTERFSAIQEAYQVLSNARLRAQYQYARHVLHPQTVTRPLAASAVEVRALAQKLHNHTRHLDPFRINRDLLYLQVTDILSDQHLHLLQEQADPLINRDIWQLLSGSLRHLTLAQLAAIRDRLAALTRHDKEATLELTRFFKENKQYHYWNRYKAVIALSLALLFCLALYLSVRN